MPTDRSRQVYDFVRAYTLRHGYAPKLREIAGHLGIRSRGVVHRHLRALEDEGLLRIEPDRARGVRLRGRVAAGRPLTLPLLGRIAAGQPIEAIPGEDEIDLSEFFVNRNRFVLRVAGDSMIGTAFTTATWWWWKNATRPITARSWWRSSTAQRPRSSACRRIVMTVSPCARLTAACRRCATRPRACVSRAW